MQCWTGAGVYPREAPTSSSPEFELKRVREGSEGSGVGAKGWPHTHGCGLDVDVPWAVFLAFKQLPSIRDQEVLSDANA